MREKGQMRYKEKKRDKCFKKYSRQLNLWKIMYKIIRIDC